MFKNKYLKYKTKYYKYKSDKINNLINQNENMKGGSYPLYVSMSRNYICDLKKTDRKKIIREAIKLNRYYKKYIDVSGNEIIEGISIGYVYPEDTRKINSLDIYYHETLLIIDELIELNNLLSKYNISTIQSQPSYYINDKEFSIPYLQLPFVEIRGDKNTIPIMKEIVNHKSLQNYYFTSYPELKDETPMIRTTIMRPYLKGNSFIEETEIRELLYGIYDKDFWNNIICVIREICEKNIKLQEITSNDTDLDKSKEWYILNKNGKIHNIIDKNKMNPFVENMPLSVLDVRYGNDLNLFTRNIDYYL